MSRVVPTAMIRVPRTAMASAAGFCLSPVHTWPLRKTRSARGPLSSARARGARVQARAAENATLDALKGRLQHVQSLGELLVSDDEGHQRSDDVAIGAGGDGDE